MINLFRTPVIVLSYEMPTMNILGSRMHDCSPAVGIAFVKTPCFHILEFNTVLSKPTF
jgi:hypothetical protein